MESNVPLLATPGEISNNTSNALSNINNLSTGTSSNNNNSNNNSKSRSSVYYRDPIHEALVLTVLKNTRCILAPVMIIQNSHDRRDSNNSHSKASGDDNQDVVHDSNSSSRASSTSTATAAAAAEKGEGEHHHHHKNQIIYVNRTAMNLLENALPFDIASRSASTNTKENTSDAKKSDYVHSNNNNNNNNNNNAGAADDDRNTIIRSTEVFNFEDYFSLYEFTVNNNNNSSMNPVNDSEFYPGQGRSSEVSEALISILNINPFASLTQGGDVSHAGTGVGGDSKQQQQQQRNGRSGSSGNFSQLVLGDYQKLFHRRVIQYLILTEKPSGHTTSSAGVQTSYLVLAASTSSVWGVTNLLERSAEAEESDEAAAYDDDRDSEDAEDEDRGRGNRGNNAPFAILMILCKLNGGVADGGPNRGNDRGVPVGYNSSYFFFNKANMEEFNRVVEARAQRRAAAGRGSFEERNSIMSHNNTNESNSKNANSNRNNTNNSSRRNSKSRIRYDADADDPSRNRRGSVGNILNATAGAATAAGGGGGGGGGGAELHTLFFRRVNSKRLSSSVKPAIPRAAASYGTSLGASFASGVVGGSPSMGAASSSHLHEPVDLLTIHTIAQRLSHIPAIRDIMEFPIPKTPLFLNFISLLSFVHASVRFAQEELRSSSGAEASAKASFYGFLNTKGQTMLVLNLVPVAKVGLCRQKLEEELSTFLCRKCNKVFSTEAGRQLHRTRAHPRQPADGTSHCSSSSSSSSNRGEEEEDEGQEDSAAQREKRLELLLLFARKYQEERVEERRQMLLDDIQRQANSAVGDSGSVTPKRNFYDQEGSGIFASSLGSNQPVSAPSTAAGAQAVSGSPIHSILNSNHHGVKRANAHATNMLPRVPSMSSDPNLPPPARKVLSGNFSDAAMEGRPSPSPNSSSQRASPVSRGHAGVDAGLPRAPQVNNDDDKSDNDRSVHSSKDADGEAEEAEEEEADCPIPINEFLSDDVKESLNSCNATILCLPQTGGITIYLPFITQDKLSKLQREDLLQLSNIRGVSLLGVSTIRLLAKEVEKREDHTFHLTHLADEQSHQQRQARRLERKKKKKAAAAAAREGEGEGEAEDNANFGKLDAEESASLVTNMDTSCTTTASLADEKKEPFEVDNELFNEWIGILDEDRRTLNQMIVRGKETTPFDTHNTTAESAKHKKQQQRKGKRETDAENFPVMRYSSSAGDLTGPRTTLPSSATHFNAAASAGSSTASVRRTKYLRGNHFVFDTPPASTPTTTAAPVGGKAGTSGEPIAVIVPSSSLSGDSRKKGKRSASKGARKASAGRSGGGGVLRQNRRGSGVVDLNYEVVEEKFIKEARKKSFNMPPLTDFYTASSDVGKDRGTSIPSDNNNAKAPSSGDNTIEEWLLKSQQQQQQKQQQQQQGYSRAGFYDDISAANFSFSDTDTKALGLPTVLGSHNADTAVDAGDQPPRKPKQKQKARHNLSKSSSSSSPDKRDANASKNNQLSSTSTDTTDKRLHPLPPPSIQRQNTLQPLNTSSASAGDNKDAPAAAAAAEGHAGVLVPRSPPPSGRQPTSGRRVGSGAHTNNSNSNSSNTIHSSRANAHNGECAPNVSVSATTIATDGSQSPPAEVIAAQSNHYNNNNNSARNHDKFALPGGSAAVENNLSIQSTDFSNDSDPVLAAAASLVPPPPAPSLVKGSVTKGTPHLTFHAPPINTTAANLSLDCMSETLNPLEARPRQEGGKAHGNSNNNSGSITLSTATTTPITSRVVPLFGGFTLPTEALEGMGKLSTQMTDEYTREKLVYKPIESAESHSRGAGDNGRGATTGAEGQQPPRRSIDDDDPENYIWKHTMGTGPNEDMSNDRIHYRDGNDNSNEEEEEEEEEEETEDTSKNTIESADNDDGGLPGGLPLGSYFNVSSVSMQGLLMSDYYNQSNKRSKGTKRGKGKRRSTGRASGVESPMKGAGVDSDDPRRHTVSSNDYASTVEEGTSAAHDDYNLRVLWKRHMHMLLYIHTADEELEERLGDRGHSVVFATRVVQMRRHLLSGLDSCYDVVVIEWTADLLPKDVYAQICHLSTMGSVVLLYYVTTATPAGGGGHRAPPPLPAEATEEVVLRYNSLREVLRDEERLTTVRRHVRLARLTRDMSEVRMKKMYQIVKEIGKGAFGDVFEVYLPASHGRLAMKRFFLKNSSLRMLEALQKEVLIMRMLDHPNIIAFSHTRMDGGAYCIFMELGNGSLTKVMENPALFRLWSSSSLDGARGAVGNGSCANGLPSPPGTPREGASGMGRSNINTNSNNSGNNRTSHSNDEQPQQQHWADKKARLTARELVVIIHDIAKGIQYLHKQNIIHRDIKPDNIMIVGGVAKIADFGSAVKCMDAEEEYSNSSSANRRPPQLTNMKGTFSYMSPEVMLGEPYNKSCDMWSFGCLLAELLGMNLGHINGLHMPALIELYQSIRSGDCLPLTISNRHVSHFENHYSKATTDGFVAALRSASGISITERNLKRSLHSRSLGGVGGGNNTTTTASSIHDDANFSLTTPQQQQPRPPGGGAGGGFALPLTLNATHSTPGPRTLTLDSHFNNHNASHHHHPQQQQQQQQQPATQTGNNSSGDGGGGDSDAHALPQFSTVLKDSTSASLPAFNSTARAGTHHFASSAAAPTPAAAAAAAAAASTPMPSVDSDTMAATLAAGLRTITCIRTDTVSVLETPTATMNEKLVELFEGLFQRDGRRRLTIDDVLNHPVCYDVAWVESALGEIRGITERLSSTADGTTSGGSNDNNNNHARRSDPNDLDLSFGSVSE